MNNNNTTNRKLVTIKFEQLRDQSIDGILRIVGFVQARHFIQVLDSLNLEANPRSAKVNRVTAAILESIEKTPELFPFKSKGVLLGATEYELLDRGRIRASFGNPHVEGILDGGHNTLSVGLHLLNVAGVPETTLKKIKDWPTFREIWDAESEKVKELRAELSNHGNAEPDSDELSFLIPVEFIGPERPGEAANEDYFKSAVLDIREARNNNAELTIPAKSNQKGYYDELREALLDKAVAERIEWKPGEPGGTVKVADLLALAWMPLALLKPMPTDEDEKEIVPPIPQNLYRNKAESVEKFDRLMSLSAVTKEYNGKAELFNPLVRSALAIAADLTKLYDRIYRDFPVVYNQLDGKYGKIVAVNKMNPANKKKYAKFTGSEVTHHSPEGFIMPLVYGLTALMERKEDGSIGWAVDPHKFLDLHFQAAVIKFKELIQAMDFDPQKVGKAPLAYSTVRDTFVLARATSNVN